MYALEHKQALQLGKQAVTRTLTSTQAHFLFL